MACRWPLALVLTAWAVAAAAITVLKQPIPIGLPLREPLPVRVDGALTIEGIAQPVRVSSEGLLGVQGTVRVDRPVTVAGAVDVNQINQPIAVGGINKPIQVGVSAKEPLDVKGSIGVENVAGRVTVQLIDAMKSLSPIPLP